MMLSTMNVTVIPFMLGALMFEDTTKWNFGPEYIFQLNKSVRVYMDFDIVENLTAMVKCRPKISSQNIQNILLCQAHKITVSRNTNIGIENIIKENASFPYKKTYTVPDQLFEIEFDRQGVQNFKMVTKKNSSNNYYDITDIIDQINIGIDLSMEAGDSMKNYGNITNGSHIISTFAHEVNTTRATKCNMSWIITYTSSNRSNEDKELWLQKNNEKFGFQLMLLPVSYTNPYGKTFLIEKTRMACTHEPKFFWILNQRWQIQDVIQYFNKMKIHDKKPKFTSYTHLEGTLNLVYSKNLHLFSEDVHLHLLRIKHAEKELATLETFITSEKPVKGQIINDIETLQI